MKLWTRQSHQQIYQYLHKYVWFHNQYFTVSSILNNRLVLPKPVYESTSSLEFSRIFHDLYGGQLQSCVSVRNGMPMVVGGLAWWVLFTGCEAPHTFSTNFVDIRIPSFDNTRWIDGPNIVLLDFVSLSSFFLPVGTGFNSSSWCYVGIVVNLCPDLVPVSHCTYCQIPS